MRILRETRAQTARRIADRVTLEHVGRTRIIYKVRIGDRSYTVSIELELKTPKGFSCTCVHGSYYGVLKNDETCYHILAVQKAIIAHGGLTW